jgi:ribosome-binding protein aMBF1 (putative translation factor)
MRVGVIRRALAGAARDRRSDRKFRHKAPARAMRQDAAMWRDPDASLDENEAVGRQIIAVAVRRARVGSGVSQRQLAWQVGLAQSTISRLETGKLRAMCMVTLARIVGALNLGPAFALPGGPTPPTRRLPGQPAA